VPVRTPARERLLACARAVFAEHGFHGARVQDIAARAGVRHPTLLYHFGSKEGLYATVIEEAFADWARETEGAISTGLRGFDQVAALVEAGFRFVGEHEDFVRIVRHEALAGGGRLEDAMAGFVRPFLDQAVGFLDGEITAGRLRPHDPLELLQLCYGTVMTYVSDARLRNKVLGADPLAPVALARHREALIGLLRAALQPV
jgi:TetR/AcrR family transcriptional regulator